MQDDKERARLRSGEPMPHRGRFQPPTQQPILVCETFHLRIDPFQPDGLSGDPMWWTSCHDAGTGLPVHAEASRSCPPPDRVITVLEELCRCRFLDTDLGRTPLLRQRKGRLERYFRALEDLQQIAGISSGASSESFDGREGGE